MSFIKNAVLLFAYLFGGVMVIGFVLASIGELFNIEEVNIAWYWWLIIVIVIIALAGFVRRRR